MQGIGAWLPDYWEFVAGCGFSISVFSASFIRLSILEFIASSVSCSFISFTSRVSLSWFTFRCVMVIKREDAVMSQVSQYQWIFVDCLVRNSYLVLVMLA